MSMTKEENQIAHNNNLLNRGKSLFEIYRKNMEPLTLFIANRRKSLFELGKNQFMRFSIHLTSKKKRQQQIHFPFLHHEWNFTLTSRILPRWRIPHEYRFPLKFHLKCWGLLSSPNKRTIESLRISALRILCFSSRRKDKKQDFCSVHLI